MLLYIGLLGLKGKFSSGWYLCTWKSPNYLHSTLLLEVSPTLSMIVVCRREQQTHQRHVFLCLWPNSSRHGLECWTKFLLGQPIGLISFVPIESKVLCRPQRYHTFFISFRLQHGRSCNGEWLNSLNSIRSKWLNSPNSLPSKWLKSLSILPSKWLNSLSSLPSNWLNSLSNLPNEWLNSRSILPSKWLNSFSSLPNKWPKFR